MTKKNYMIIALLIIAAVAGFMWWNAMEKAQAPELQEIAVPADTTDTIQDDLGKIEVGNIDADFTDVDKEINNL